MLSRILILYTSLFFIKSVLSYVTNSTPVYNVGILFPKQNVNDSNLANMIATNELAIQLAVESINTSNILPDVKLNFTRYYSDQSDPRITAWTAMKMVENGVNAVIGDLVSTMTEASAAITGIWRIPQCSSASASYHLSNKNTFPYFFRTVSSGIIYGDSLVDWVSNMGWNVFSVIYTNDIVGQQIFHSMLDEAKKNDITVVTSIPLYSLDDDQIEESLTTLKQSGSRVIILADSDPNDQIAILKKAMFLGLLSRGWVWIVTNNISPILHEIVDSKDQLYLLDGLMYISGLWDLSGDSAYDNFNQIWKSQRVPTYFSNSSEWNTTSLSYNAPNAYSCAELLALGLNKALNMYPGGRTSGLKDLYNKSFNSTNMTPEFYNMNYTGPAGNMRFSRTGDLESGYLQISYIKNGVGVPYAKIKLDEFSFIPNITVEYLGQTTLKPMGLAAKLALNPTTKQVSGILILVVCYIGISFSALMMCLIFWFQNLKPIVIASPIFCYIQLIGISMVYVSTALYVYHPTPAKCIARKFLIYIGFALILSSIIAKNYRVYRVFQNVFAIRTSKLKSVYLIRIVALFTLIGLVPLIIWNAIFPIAVSEIMITTNTYCWFCVYPNASFGNWNNMYLVDVIATVWMSTMIIMSAFLAIKTRNVNSKWSETTQIAHVSYVTGLTAVLASLSFFIPLNNFQVSIFLTIACILFDITFTLMILFAPMFVYIVKFIIKHNKFSLYRMNAESQSNLTNQATRNAEYYTGNTNTDLLNENLFDSSMRAYEGILPVKKLAKFDFLSIWDIKHIVLVPIKRYFILSDSKSGQESSLHHYVHCEAVPSNDQQNWFFCVRTDKGIVFKFQVSDKESLDKWLGWFDEKNNSEAASTTLNGDNNDKTAKPAKPAKTVTIMENNGNNGTMIPANVFVSPQKSQCATFGIGESSSLAHASSSFFYNNSSFFYPQNSVSYYTENIEDVKDNRSSMRYNSHHLTPIRKKESHNSIKDADRSSFE